MNTRTKKEIQKSATWKIQRKWNVKRKECRKEQHENSAIWKRCNMELAEHQKIVTCKEYNRRRMQKEKSATLKKTLDEKLYESATWKTRVISKKCNMKRLQHKGKAPWNKRNTKKSATWQKKQYGNMQLEQSVKQNKCNTKKCNIKRAENGKGGK